MSATFDDDADESPWDEEPTRAVPPESPKWFTLTEADEQEGPFTVSDLRARLATGQLTTDTYVWNAGLSDWAPVAALPLWSELTAPEPAAKPARAPGLLAPPTFTPESQLVDDSRTAADPSFREPPASAGGLGDPAPPFLGVPDSSPERTQVQALPEGLDREPISATQLEAAHPSGLSESEHPTGPRPPEAPAESRPSPLGPKPAPLPRSPDSLASFLFADISHGSSSKEPPTEIHMPDSYGTSTPRPRNDGVVSAIRSPGELAANERSESIETPAVSHSPPRWIWGLVVVALAVIVFLVTRALR